MFSGITGKRYVRRNRERQTGLINGVPARTIKGAVKAERKAITLLELYSKMPIAAPLSRASARMRLAMSGGKWCNAVKSVRTLAEGPADVTSTDSRWNRIDPPEDVANRLRVGIFGRRSVSVTLTSNWR